jgi:SpoVK/Ycf46/Vps4 family AAA+-type ATPase
MPPADPAVLAVLESAVASSPDSLPLRRHLAQLLFDTGRSHEALEHCSQILARAPDDLQALHLAANAAKDLGDEARAAGFRRLISALQPSVSPDASEGAEGRAPLRVIRGGADGVTPPAEAPGLTLADVAGLEGVKRRLELAFLGPMRNPDLRRAYGKPLRGGLLLYGPPGCGKTFVAKAVAGELGAKFISIGLSDVLNLWLGESERNVHEIFETARRNAPCVVFFDELDGLGRKRSLSRQSAERNVITQLLAELDNVQSENEGIFVLAATNHPWDVDSALRRPGRFDRTLLVLPPDRAAREFILKRGLSGRPVSRIDTASVAAKTDGFSGADLVHLCEAAVEFAMEDSLRTNRIRPIAEEDFRRALEEVRPSTRSWFSTARNYAEFANEGGMFDDLLEYLRTHRIK